MSDPLKILSLQPFYAGSHRAVMQGWVRHSRLDWRVLSLPGEYWKWRMRYAAIQFARQANALDRQGDRFDALFCTDMMNLAEFKGLASPRISQLPTVIYFHENQLAYPVKNPDRQDLHFAFTNLASALAADQIWFNSCFNRESMCELFCAHSQLWPEQVLQDDIERIQHNGIAHYPGIEIPEQFSGSTSDRMKTDRPLHIVWAARWEHDKGPGELLRAIQFLVERDAEFRLSVIGETFRNVPEEFHALKELGGDHILHWGYQETREDYWQVLADADVFVSTAKHEFFGLSAAEAIAVGCFPLLPNRLAYPELLDLQNNPDHQLFLYDGSAGDLGKRLLGLISDRSQLVDETTKLLPEKFRARYSWQTRAREMDKAMRYLVSPA